MHATAKRRSASFPFFATSLVRVSCEKAFFLSVMHLPFPLPEFTSPFSHFWIIFFFFLHWEVAFQHLREKTLFRSLKSFLPSPMRPSLSPFHPWLIIRSLKEFVAFVLPIVALFRLKVPSPCLPYFQRVLKVIIPLAPALL